MSRNFFGAVADFYLQDNKFTSLRSSTVRDGMRFAPGEVYMARIKMRRSVTGSRIYSYEKPSFIRNSYVRDGAASWLPDPAEGGTLTGSTGKLLESKAKFSETSYFELSSRSD